MRFAQVALVVLLLSPCALGDTPAAARAYVGVGDGGHYYFKILPCLKNSSDLSCGSVRVYEVSDEGPDRPVWSASGWFAFSAYLSDDGKYLVRMGDWPGGSEPSDSDLAIAFYEDGKLLKQYSTKQLIRDPSKVVRSVSHYQFLREVRGFQPYTKMFTIVAVDGTEYTFDVRHGDIVREK